MAFMSSMQKRYYRQLSVIKGYLWIEVIKRYL